MKRIIFTISLLLSLFSQDSTLFKNVYIGFGLGIGTNLGGVIGFGFEKELYKNFSGNIAIGSLHPFLDQETTFSKFGYDIGLKFYVINELFLGANYGFVEYQTSKLIINGNTVSDFTEKMEGFSLNIGYKVKISSRFRLSFYLAKWINRKNKSTGNSLTDDVVSKYDDIPGFGFLLGYNL